MKWIEKHLLILKEMICIGLLSGCLTLAYGGEANVKEFWLDEVNLRYATCGWGTPHVNRSVEGRSLMIGGDTFQRGVGTHSEGRIWLELAGRAVSFSGSVGIDDETNGGGCAIFQVIGDDKVLWDSGKVRGGEKARAFDVKLEGVEVLELLVLESEGGYSHDHADWVNAKITYSSHRPQAIRPAMFGEYGVLTHQIRDYGKTAKSPQATLIAKQAFHAESLIFESDRDPVDVVIRRTAALITAIERMPHGPQLTGDARALAAFKAENARVTLNDKAGRKALFNQVCQLRRKVAFANPLLNFDKILFIKRHFNPNDEKTGNHMCDQYFGFHAIQGGGLFVLENPFSDTPTLRNVLANSVCENGRFKGRTLTAEGGFLSPDLSFDGKQILFAYTDIEKANRKRYVWNEDNTWHIFMVNVDGTGLRQLTDGVTNDFDPCFMPNGRIVFISERRGGYGRCHGRPVPSFTLHSMNKDGSDIVMLSPHETNEWQPSVDHQGMIIYTRWDYVDRGFNQAHHPWVTSPDGRDSRVIHGNYAPAQHLRPHMEMDIRAIPDSNKLVATAACHHGQAYGSLVIVDPKIEDDDAMGPVRRITPDQLFPESENRTHMDPVNYSSAWPLSENFYLCVYDANSKSNEGTRNNYGIYLLDVFGNKELLYRDPAISCLNPMPLRTRGKPPVVPHQTFVGKPLEAGEKFVPLDPVTIPQTGEVGLIDVYNSLKPYPEGVAIKALRIVQLLPKTTPLANQPRVGFGDQKSARAILGTVPVEADGSAYFKLPVNIPVYFQAIDGDGLAVQSMRSATYVHPGEKLVCNGCHEKRHGAPLIPDHYPTAMKRQPSEITPEVAGARPFSYPLLVQPVLNRKCVPCHQKQKKAPDLRMGDLAKNPNHFYTSYRSLRPHAFFFDNAVYTTPRTIPGQFGARASKLYQMLSKGHHDVTLSKDEMHRITLWLDSNSDFFGSYENIDAQAKGEVVAPTMQ